METVNEKRLIRLNKFLSEAGVCSRREADRLIEAGAVLVDGSVASCGLKIDPEKNEIQVNGQHISKKDKRILLALNKPRGYVCTTDTRWGDKTVYELMDFPERVFSIGRLDKDSEGLLLMTNDGDILNRIMRAGNYHEKEYLVTTDREVTADFTEKMSRGVYLSELDQTTRACKVSKIGKYGFRIILTQGLNRQIRRMCAELGYKVKTLKRVRIMNIKLGNLETGVYRELTAEENEELNRQLRQSRN